MITKSHVKHIASLACLELSEDDLQEFTVQFNSILSYFDELSEIEEAPEKDKVRFNDLRADEVLPSLSQEEALSNAPKTEDGYFKGPRIL
jgi:aspartyl-tRNA(Asn)/glutamyl-tRNA(Gln) amidotransferase subunit C